MHNALKSVRKSAMNQAGQSKENVLAKKECKEIDIDNEVEATSEIYENSFINDESEENSGDSNEDILSDENDGNIENIRAFP